MQDLHAKLEKLLSEAEDCTLIAKLAGDPQKRATFTKLAIQLKAMARDLQSAIVERAKAHVNDAA